MVDLSFFISALRAGTTLGVRNETGQVRLREQRYLVVPCCIPTP